MSENIPYIIAENGFYYVAYKEKVKVPEIVVSSKGVANGLSEEYNDGWDFGPDSYNPTSTSAIPYTESTGIGEALQYAISNPIMYNSDVGGYWIPEVRFTGGYYTISQPIVLNVPYRIMNLTLKGVDAMSPYIGCAFNTTSSDEYPYAININSSDISNISYINIQWEHLQPQVASGYTPYGFVNFDFSSVNTGTNVFIGYDLNVSNPGFTYAFHLVGFQQIHMYDFEAYGSTCYFDAGYCEVIGGYFDAPILIGGVSNGSYFSNGYGGNYSAGYGLVPVGNISNLLLLNMPLAIGTYNSDIGNITIGNVTLMNISSVTGFNRAIIGEYSSGTATINRLNVYGAVPLGMTSNNPFIDNTQGGTLTVNSYNIHDVVPNPQGYYWTGIPANTTNPQLSNTTSGTTAGTGVQVQTNYETLYKRIVFTFDGYENDTTTNQVIDFINSFSTVASITANTTGLTVAATTSAITITAPDATTTYTGIVIVEGY